MHLTSNPLGITYGLPGEGQWTRLADGSFTRLCGYNEHRHYWDSVHNGIADALEDVVIDVRSDVPVQSIFNEQNVTRAWTHVKHLYPLLGVRIEEQDGHARFVIFEKNLRTVHPGELVFRQVSSDKQACDMLLEIVNGKRTLSPRYPVRVYILTRSDTPQRVHVVYQVSHVVSDGIAQATLKATFLNLLVKPRPLIEKLEDRLALSLASETLWHRYPRRSPRQRWRLAIATVMKSLRPLYGGHTLPSKVTTATPYSTVISARETTPLSPELSRRILAGCKRIGITFGSVFPVIGQVAMTRLLFRLYTHRKISEEEWEFRKREPMLTSGPINTRPMVNERWYNDGGKGHVCASVATFTLSLPFMPLGAFSNVKPAAGTETPPFSSFLSAKRFLLRCRAVQRQFQTFLRHPLFFEKDYVFLPGLLRTIKDGAIRWKEEQNKPEELRDKGVDISLKELSRAGPVWTHTGSSFGATDCIYPRSFPLELRPGEAPILSIGQRNEIQLHCRPTELYLGSTFERGRIYMFVHWDANVYEADMVKDYLTEVCKAAEWYLANAHGHSEHEQSGLQSKL